MLLLVQKCILHQQFFDFLDESLISCDDLNSIVAKLSFDDSKTEEFKHTTQILLVTANQIEYNAVIASLDPLEEYSCLLKYHYVSNLHGKNAFYIFGKFGHFNAAVHLMSDQGPAAAQDVITVAADCFGHHLNAIFAVGVACGVKGKAKMLDVLVSEKISVYTAARISTTSDGGYKIENRGQFNIPVSSFLRTYFDQPPKWPTASSKIVNNLPRTPTLHKGNILSGNYLIDNQEFKDLLLQEFAYNAIGIEMEGAGLVHGSPDGKYKIMIVKGVCDFGDGKKNKKYQPTAAMLAVECLKHYFSSPQLPEKFATFCDSKGMLRTLHRYMCIHVYMYIAMCLMVFN